MHNYRSSCHIQYATTENAVVQSLSTKLLLKLQVLVKHCTQLQQWQGGRQGGKERGEGLAYRKPQLISLRVSSPHHTSHGSSFHQMLQDSKDLLLFWDLGQFASVQYSEITEKIYLQEIMTQEGNYNTLMCLISSTDTMLSTLMGIHPKKVI